MKNPVRKYFICAFSAVLFSGTSYSQQFADKKFYLLDSLDLSPLENSNRRIVDSCLNLYHGNSNDTFKITAVMHIVDECWNENVWPRYNDWALKILNERLSAPQKYSSQQLLFYKKTMALVINNRGFLYGGHGDFAKALEDYEICLKLRGELQDRPGIAASFNNLGSIYESMGDIVRSLDYYHRSLKIREEIKEIKGIGNTLNNIGAVYMSQGEIEKANDYWQRALVFRKEAGDKSGEATSLSNLAGIFEAKNRFGEALGYYFKARDIHRAMGNKSAEARCLRNISRTYEDMAMKNKNKKNVSALRDTALSFVKQSLALREEVKDKKGIASSLCGLGQIYLDMNKYDEAEKCGIRSLEIARQINTLSNISEAAFLLYSVYKNKNKSQRALEMYELWITMKDSLLSQQNKKAGIKQELKYEYEKKAAADSVKNAEGQKVKDAQLAAQTASLKQEKFQRYSLAVGLLAVLIGLGFVVNRFRITQKQKRIIEKQKIIVDEAFEKLAEKNKEVIDSIHYARRIQRALITSEKYIERQLKKLKN